MTELNYRCCFCNEMVKLCGEDPCHLLISTKVDRAEDEQMDQTFYCHKDCFRQILHSDSEQSLTVGSACSCQETRGALMRDFMMILHDLEHNFATIDAFRVLEDELVEKLVGVFDAIQKCTSVAEAEMYFTFLSLIQGMLALLLYQEDIDAPDAIWTFAKDFDRIDDLRQRAWIFREIKSGEYQKQYYRKDSHGAELVVES